MCIRDSNNPLRRSIEGGEKYIFKPIVKVSPLIMEQGAASKMCIRDRNMAVEPMFCVGSCKKFLCRTNSLHSTVPHRSIPAEMCIRDRGL